MLAVPVFFVLSFFLSAKTLSGVSAPRAKRKRLIRIAVPFAVWTPVLAAAGSVSGFGAGECIGHLWFLVALFLWSAWFSLVWPGRFARTRLGRLWFPCAVAAIGLVWQYAGLNDISFGAFPQPLRYRLCWTADMAPFAGCGLFMAVSGISTKISGSRFRLLHLVWIAGLCWPFCLFRLPDPPGFGYGGLFRVRAAAALVLLFALLPLERIPVRFRRIVEILSSYSLGVYCLHPLTGRWLSRVGGDGIVEPGGLTWCLLVWGGSWMLSAVLVRLYPRSVAVVR